MYSKYNKTATTLYKQIEYLQNQLDKIKDLSNFNIYINKRYISCCEIVLKDKNIDYLTTNYLPKNVLAVISKKLKFGGF